MKSLSMQQRLDQAAAAAQARIAEENFSRVIAEYSELERERESIAKRAAELTEEAKANNQKRAQKYAELEEAKAICSEVYARFTSIPPKAVPAPPAQKAFSAPKPLTDDDMEDALAKSLLSEKP